MKSPFSVSKGCKRLCGRICFNPVALRQAKIVSNFGLSECNRVKVNVYTFRSDNSVMEL